MTYIPRYIEDIILRSSTEFKVIFLGGPRQAGKTTVLQKLARSRKMNYVTLDNINQRELARKDPLLFLQQHDQPLVIDEIQYAPQLLSAIKEIVDSSDRTGQYWLTGSQQFSLIKNIRESLAGRVAVLNLLGLSFAEIHKYRKSDTVFLSSKITKKTAYPKPRINKLFTDIFTGSYPALHSGKKPDREIFYNSYIQTYIDRDLSDIFGINKISQFNKFIQICAARSAQVLNMSDMAQDAGISVSTATDWLGILQSNLQILLLEPYYKNITKRMIKAPKLYFLDTGLASYLTRWSSPETLQTSSLNGAYFETYLVSEIYKSYIFRGIQPKIYYYRDKEKRETDLIIDSEKINIAEIKLSARISQIDTRNMLYVAKKYHVHSMTVLCMTGDIYTAGNGIQYIPYTYIN